MYSASSLKLAGHGSSTGTSTPTTPALGMHVIEPHAGSAQSARPSQLSSTPLSQISIVAGHARLPTPAPPSRALPPEPPAPRSTSPASPASCDSPPSEAEAPACGVCSLPGLNSGKLAGSTLALVHV